MTKLLAGRYHLGEVIGRGGYGLVHQGTWLLPGEEERPVAIKALLPELQHEPEACARLLREAQLGMKVAGGHDAFPTVYDVFEEGGTIYMVTDLVRGLSLRDLVERAFMLPGGKLPLACIRAILAACAEGLRHCHAHQVLHRDLSPANIMVSEEGQVQIVDLGLAAAIEGSGVLGRAHGTLAFASYEQMQGEKMDPSSDLYAIASVIYYAASGHPPFGRDRDTILARMAVDDLPSLFGLPDDLQRILAGLLVHRPDRRFTDTAQVLAALTGDVASSEELAMLVDRCSGKRAASMLAEQPGEARSDAETLVRTQPRASASPVRIKLDARQRARVWEREQAEPGREDEGRTPPGSHGWLGWLRERQGVVMVSLVAVMVALLLGRHAAHRDRALATDVPMGPVSTDVSPAPPAQGAYSLCEVDAPDDADVPAQAAVQKVPPTPQQTRKARAQANLPLFSPNPIRAYPTR
ncbi:serine/threonine protein kinase [Haliangium sp.]|uniref:serine/threonine protein kinase n=1 Tax=Haliangium sp. TaxID=2663208 RepID=UPI003D0FB5C5